jgi:hypothetical protein
MMTISREAMARGGASRSPKKMRQLKLARAKRGIAAMRRTAPPGFKSVELFLEELRIFCRKNKLGRELARHLQVNEGMVRHWLSHQQLPTGKTESVPSHEVGSASVFAGQVKSPESGSSLVFRRILRRVSGCQ